MYVSVLFELRNGLLFFAILRIFTQNILRFYAYLSKNILRFYAYLPKMQIICRQRRNIYETYTIDIR